jgi:TetR/AcrR family transcriptional regulator, multidrug resistance operon repressor
MTDNKRELILSAAEKIIATQGLHQMSMQKLANLAGVAAGTIYRYFKDKEELVDELRQHVLLQVAEQILLDIDKGSIEARFKRVWFNILKLGTEQSPDQLSYEQYCHLPGTDTREHLLFEMQTFAPLHLLFSEAREQGLFQPLQDEYLSAIALEPAISLGRRIRLGHLTFNQTELEHACDLCWRALLTPTQPTQREQSGI